MKKRNLIALLMVVCMMFSLLPVNAIAVGDEGTIPAEETLLSENGNDPAPAGSTNPAGDKDSIPDTGDKPSAAEEPAKDEEPAKGEESGKDEEPAKDEEPGKDEEPAEDEEGGETNVVPMRVVRPDTDKYLTYVFRVDGAEVSRQIVKKGDTLYQPDSPVKDGYKFTGWFVGASELAFGTVGEISESAQINVDAGFTEVLYVFFADTNGRIVHTKEGVKGDVIKTDDVTYGLENTTHAITGWYLEGSYQTPVDSVTLDKENITVYAKVEPGHWLHFDSDGGTYVAPQFYSADATTAKPNVEITKPGYTFSHWEYNGTKFEFGSPLTENITLKAHWNVNTSTRYTVIHWQENADDDGYSYVENETLYGTTGAQTSARAKTYNGFTVQAITQETIKGNGATIVNIYYTRNVYEVKFYRRTSSWNSGWSEITNNRISAKYGANIRDQWPGGQWKVSPSGSVYQTNIDVMPLGGTSFYETSQYNGSAKYYLEDLNGNYVLDHTDTGASTTATISKEDRYNITGFTVNESKSGKDGERYNGASFYYDRNSYNVVNISHGQTVNTASYKYQQSIADAGNYKLTTPPVGMEKYIFAGWCADPFGLPEYVFDGKTMPAQNITVYAYWAAPTVSGVAYITMEGTGGKNLTIPYGGTIDESMLPDPQKPAGDGWTFAGWTTKNGDTYTPFHFSTKIYDNIELYPYYTNKNNYTVTYTDGKNTVTDMKHYASGAHADVQANSFAVPEGKVFLGWAETADGAVKYQPNDKLRMNASVTLHAVWGNKDAVVSLTYNANGGQGGTYVKNGYVNNDLVTLWDGSGFSRTGYSLDGWSTDPNAANAEYKTGSTARVDSTGDNILYAVWKANENTAYKVEFYCEQTDGAYTLEKTEPRTGTTDTTVSVTDGDKAYGTPTYVYDATNPNRVESGTVAADGSLTLKLYFKRNTAEYTIHHYLKGTEVKVAPDQTGTMTIGDTLTASASTALGAEYASAHANSYSPSQSLKMEATGNVITVYYTVPLTITAENASRAYNAQPLTQPDFKVEGLVNGDQKKDITLSMTKESTITNVGSVSNVIDTTTVRFKGGALPGGYYELPTYKPGTLTITADETEVVVTITGNHDTRVYNGGEQSVTGYTTDVGEKTITVALKEGSKAEAKGTNAGTYYMGLTKDNFTVTSQNYSNIKVVVVDGYLKIDPITEKVTVTVTEKSDTVTYNGQEHSVTGYKSMTADNALYDVKKNVAETSTEAWTAKGTYVGTYHVGIKAADFKNTSGNFTNVEFVIVDGDLVITPASVAVVKIAGNTKTVTYNGEMQSVEGYTVTSNPANATVTLVGEAVASGTDANTYPMGLTAADFTATSPNYKNVTIEVTDGYLEIDPITDKVTVTVTEKSGSAVYNGQEHSVTGYETMTANNALYDVKKNVAETQTAAWTAKGTDVGEYPVGIEASDFENTSVNFPNVEFVVVDGALNITPAENIAVKIAGSTKTVIYDGTEQTVEGYTVTSNPADATVTLVGEAVASGTDANTYPMGLKPSDFTATSPNYKKITIEVTDGWLKIDPIADKVTVTVTENSAAVTYDGTEHSVTGYKSMTADNTLYDVEKNVAEKPTKAWTAKGTDAGEYPVGIVSGDFRNTSKNFTNVEFVIVDGTLKIDPVSDKVTVTITENADTVIYDTKEHSVKGYKSVTADNALYDVKKNVAETSTEAWTAKGTDVGEYPVGIKADDFENTSSNFTNVEFVIVDGALKIAPAESIVVKIAGNTKTVTYNGEEQSVEGYTVTSNPANADVTLVGKAAASGTDAGTYPMGLTAADFTATSPNYETVVIEVTDGWLKINPVSDKVTVTVTEKSGSVVYDGQEHSVTGYETMAADNALYNTADVAETPTEAWTAKGTNAGKYRVGIKSGDFKNTSVNFTNVAFVIVDGELEITPVTDKVTVTVVEKSDNVTYDAAEHSITGYETMTADNALYDIANVAKTPTAAWTAKGTEAGEYPVGIVSGDFKNTSKNFANVEFVIVDGALTITTDDTEVVVTVTGNTKTVVYDGTEHSVEGYTVDVNGLPITVTPKAGTEAKASGTNAGTYYMGLTADDFTAESNNYSNIRIAVTDGWLKIDPITDKVTVTVTENADTVEYDGKEHSVTGYASIVSDHALYDVANVAETPTDVWTAKGTDAGTYPVGIKSGDFKNTSGNFTNVEFVIVDGELVITRRGENPGSPVTLRADDSTVMFDGDYHGYVGHIATNLAEGHSVRSVKSDFTARNVGRYEDKIDLHDAIIVDADGKDVTRNYVLTYQPGTLEITPFEGEVVVTVTGNTGLFRYDGKIHTVEGYTFEATVPFFTEDDIRFTGDATISEVRPGDYVMNLKDEEFSAANDNFTSVKFVVIDGSMRIYTVRYTVAWMFDTDQMLTGDSPNRYFTSMANYIDRSDISLVLHSGNVVADAGAQSQWDVFNNAMQPLYDDEEVDVLMIAAEKEAASGSLFLQQPVREDFKEEDLFENGKGFVRRFNIGEKSVILVGLGADAMTEEGYKWAREKFNSDKDASGILLVNNYLLEDMRKPDKIDERALDLEKNVVKACSNVRMVLSSSGGYSSHYEFYYGERKVIAINSDIEAAAKAGYFTQLTFNEDLNILSVTNLCPYTYDFVYNERQAYKECYVLNNVL